MARAKFYGNKKRKKIHKANQKRSGCKIAELDKENVVRSDSVEKLESDGFVKCKHCFKD